MMGDNTLSQTSNKYPKEKARLGHRRINQEGEVTYKRKTTSEIQSAIQMGIKVSVSMSHKSDKRDMLLKDFGVVETMAFPKCGSKDTPQHDLSDFKFKTFAPIAFRYFRDFFQVNVNEYLNSICHQDLKELSNAGASGSIFYITCDDEFIIKTVQHKEASFLQKLLPEYYINLIQHPRTLLPKFYGLYCYQTMGKNIRFVIMNNLLPSIAIHEKYDLKGSTYKRLANDNEKAKSSPTLKDLDFKNIHPEGLFLEVETYDALLNTIQRDCRVLESFSIMDYSLLLGIHNLDRRRSHTKPVNQFQQNTTSTDLSFLMKPSDEESQIPSVQSQHKPICQPPLKCFCKKLRQPKDSDNILLSPQSKVSSPDVFTRFTLVESKYNSPTFTKPSENPSTFEPSISQLTENQMPTKTFSRFTEQSTISTEKSSQNQQPIISNSSVSNASSYHQLLQSNNKQMTPIQDEFNQTQEKDNSTSGDYTTPELIVSNGSVTPRDNDISDNDTDHDAKLFKMELDELEHQNYDIDANIDAEQQFYEHDKRLFGKTSDVDEDDILQIMAESSDRHERDQIKTRIIQMKFEAGRSHAKNIASNLMVPFTRKFWNVLSHSVYNTLTGRNDSTSSSTRRQTINDNTLRDYVESALESILLNCNDKLYSIEASEAPLAILSSGSSLTELEIESLSETNSNPVLPKLSQDDRHSSLFRRQVSSDSMDFIQDDDPYSMTMIDPSVYLISDSRPRTFSLMHSNGEIKSGSNSKQKNQSNFTNTDDSQPSNTKKDSILNRYEAKSKSTKRIAAWSTVLESIQANFEWAALDTSDHGTIPAGGIPARNKVGDRLILFMGIIDILQSYQLAKKMEHNLKAVFLDPESISVCNPTFYALRFQDFFSIQVFKKIPSLDQPQILGNHARRFRNFVHYAMKRQPTQSKEINLKIQEINLRIQVINY